VNRTIAIKIYLEDHREVTAFMLSFVMAHSNLNYGWIFGIDNIKGKIENRND
jgi:hypothetical protein